MVRAISGTSEIVVNVFMCCSPDGQGPPSRESVKSPRDGRVSGLSFRRQTIVSKILCGSYPSNSCQSQIPQKIPTARKAFVKIIVAEKISASAVAELQE